jgi:RTA1 like protein
VLYGVSSILTIRNIFRVAEYLGGREGFLLRVEWPIYVFNAIFMAVTMAIFYWWYPPAQQFRVVDFKISVETPPVQMADEFGGRLNLFVLYVASST